MDLSRLTDVGAAQRRYRTQLAKEGWRPICTYTRIEHRIALEQLQRQHELNTLHEALDLVLTACTLPLFNGITVKKRARRTALPCLSTE